MSSSMEYITALDDNTSRWIIHLFYNLFFFHKCQIEFIVSIHNISKNTYKLLQMTTTKCSYETCDQVGVSEYLNYTPTEPNHFLCQKHNDAHLHQKSTISRISYFRSLPLRVIMDKANDTLAILTSRKEKLIKYGICAYETCSRVASYSDIIMMCTPHFRTLCSVNSISQTPTASQELLLIQYRDSMPFRICLDDITSAIDCPLEELCVNDKPKVLLYDLPSMIAKHKKYVIDQVTQICDVFITDIDKKVSIASTTDKSEIEHELVINRIDGLSHINTCRYVCVRLVNHYLAHGWSDKHILFQTNRTPNIDKFYLRWSDTISADEDIKVIKTLQTHKWVPLV